MCWKDVLYISRVTIKKDFNIPKDAVFFTKVQDGTWSAVPKY